jgi:enamine deaminase RidA (YjgF/YER057c/UK114 family)
MTPDGKFAGGSGDFRAQVTQAFENLKLALAACGATFDHVVKVTVYFIDMAHLRTYFEVRDRFVNTKTPPASTAVQISKLARDGALFEIEAIAVAPE